MPEHRMESEKSVYLDREEHFHKGTVSAKTVVVYGYDASTDTLNPIQGYGSLVPALYDEIDVSPDTSRPVTVVYKNAGVTVATLTITYDGSTSNITQVVRS